MCLNMRFNKAQKPRIIAFVGKPYTLNPEP